MHQFVQSAIDAANQGDTNKAMNFLREVLTANPNDVDAWLVLAAVVDEPKRKRQCLNRVLALDPVNKLAREELLEMDRLEMGNTPPFLPEADSVFEAAPPPAPKASGGLEDRSAAQPTPTQTRHVSLHDWAEEKPARTRTEAKPRAGKPQVFRYAAFARIAIYGLAALFLCSFVLAWQDLRLLLVPCGAYLLILPAVWIVSRQVEVGENGIRASQLFGLTGSEVRWDEIARIQSHSLQRSLELVTKKGSSVRVTTQVSGYPAIVEALRQRRPDLFNMAAASPGGSFAAKPASSSPLGNDIPTVPPSISGTHTFRKNLFRQYGLLLLVIPFGVLSAWTAYAEPQYRLGAILSAAFCFVFTLLPFFQIGLVKVEPNRLIVESFFEQKTFSAKEIREVNMASVRGRYGRVTNFVNVVTANGRNYPLQDFSGGDEVIYGILHQWWESYRNR